MDLNIKSPITKKCRLHHCRRYFFPSYADFQIRMNIPTTAPHNKIRNITKTTGLLTINVISEPMEVMNHVNISVAALRMSAREPAVLVKNDGRYIVKKTFMI